jgi:hypothetical protein
VVPQHKFVVADSRFQIHIQWNKCIKVPRMKWWKLKEESADFHGEGS